MSTHAEAWFAGRDWRPFDFQREVWAAMAAGRSGLLHATTGAGKTYAVWFGALACGLVGHAGARPLAEGAGRGGGAVDGPDGVSRAPALQVLWITPMRALAADTLKAIQRPLAELSPAWTTGLRSGDTPSAERARQDRRIECVEPAMPSPLSLPLMVERFREQLTTEKLAVRLDKMLADMNATLDASPKTARRRHA